MSRKKKPEQSVPQTPSQSQQPEQVPQDLADKVATLRLLTSTHALLNQGMFSVGYAPKVQQSIEFIASLHQQLMADCLVHPKADLIPDLAAEKKARLQGVK